MRGRKVPKEALVLPGVQEDDYGSWKVVEVEVDAVCSMGPGFRQPNTRGELGLIIKRSSESHRPKDG